MKYKKRPVEIEAIQFTRNNWNEIVEFTNGKAFNFAIEKRPSGYAYCLIRTLDGDMKAKNGDYIIKGIQGEFYPCKPDIFESTYEKVDE